MIKASMMGHRLGKESVGIDGTQGARPAVVHQKEATAPDSTARRAKANKEGLVMGAVIKSP